MSTVQLSSLRVSADLDSRQYVSGMNAKVSADKAGAQSSQAVGRAVTQTDTKLNQSSNVLERLSRQYVDGYASAARFDKAVRDLGRGIETGNVPLQRAETILDGIYRKYGLTADAAEVAARGHTQLAGAVTTVNARLEQTEGAADGAALAQQRLAASTGMVAMQQRMLMFQLNDIAVSLASGMNPMMVMMQQGAQVQQIYAGQGGVNAAVKQLGGMALGAARVLVGPFGLAIGGAAAAIAGMRHEIEESTGVAVSFGDTALAVFETIWDGVTSVLQPVTDEISRLFGSAWNYIIDETKRVGNLILNSFEAAKVGLELIWEGVPGALGSITVAAGNAVVGAVENMLNGTVERVNFFINEINGLISQLPEWARPEGAGIPTVPEVNFPDIPNPWEGSEGAQRVEGELARIFGQDRMGQFFSEVQQRAIDNFNERLEETEDAAGGAADGMSDAAKEAEKLAEAYAKIVDGAQKFIADQQLEGFLVGMPEEQANALRYEMEMLNKASDAGIDLTSVQRAEISGLAGDMAHAEAETQRLTDAYEQQKEMWKTVGGIISDLFSKPIEDAEQFFDTVLSGFAKIGQSNLDSLFDNFFGGIPAAANDNGGSPAGGVDHVAKVLGGAVESGAATGSATGSATGIAAILGKSSGYISAGLGGLGIGYQTQNPFMGAVGGALQGFSAGAAMGGAGGPIGAVIGGIAGLIGGIMGMNKAVAEAREKIDQQRVALEQLIAAANGEIVSDYAQQLAEMNTKLNEAIALADKANDRQLQRELMLARDNVRGTLAEDFREELQSSLWSLRDMGFLNAARDAQEQYNTRLKDAAELGTSADGAMDELRLTLQGIAKEANLTESQLAMMASVFPQLAGAMRSVQASPAASPIPGMLDSAVQWAQGDVDRARAELQQAYQRESSAIQQVIDRTNQYVTSLRQFRDGLRLDSNLSPLNPYARMVEARDQFQEISARALNGDREAIEQLEGVSRQYLDEARAYYATSESYFSIFGSVESILDQALTKAEGQLSEAERQLKELQDQTGALIDIRDGQLSIADAINNLSGAMANLDQARQRYDDATGFSAEIEKLYRDVVGRAPDREGAEFWQARIDSGIPMAEIYRRFIGDVIKLGATPDAEAIARWGIDAGGSQPLPGYANGGMHGGGFAMVGERGPEIRAFGPSRFWSSAQTQAMLSGSNDNSALVGEVRALRQEVVMLRTVNGATAENTAEIARSNSAMEKTERKQVQSQRLNRGRLTG